jgi:hypothetical protein
VHDVSVEVYVMNPTKITIVSLYESSNPSALLLLLFTKHLLMTAARSPAPVHRCSYKLEHWFTMAAGIAGARGVVQLLRFPSMLNDAVCT